MTGTTNELQSQSHYITEHGTPAPHMSQTITSHSNSKQIFQTPQPQTNNNLGTMTQSAFSVNERSEESESLQATQK